MLLRAPERSPPRERRLSPSCRTATIESTASQTRRVAVTASGGAPSSRRSGAVCSRLGAARSGAPAVRRSRVRCASLSDRTQVRVGSGECETRGVSIFGDRVMVPSGFERYAFVRRSPSDDVDDEGAELTSELADLAGPHTSTPDLIWYAIWEGYGWGTATTLYAAPSGPLGWVVDVRARRQQRRAVRDRSVRVREGLGQVPSFDVPLRRYFLPICGGRRIETGS